MGRGPVRPIKFSFGGPWPGPAHQIFQGYVLQGLWTSGKGMGVLQNFQKFRVRVWKCYRTHRSFGYCGAGVQNSQKFRAGTQSAVPVPWVLWYGEYRAYRSSGYLYACPTKLTEVPATGMRVLQNFQRFRVLWHGRTEFTEVAGRYENAVPVPRLMWHGAYRTHRSSGYGYENLTELPEVPGIVAWAYRTCRSSG